MAIIGKQTINNIHLLEVDSDPQGDITLADLPIGSKVYWNDAGTAKEYTKTGSGVATFTSFVTADQVTQNAVMAVLDPIGEPISVNDLLEYYVPPSETLVSFAPLNTNIGYIIFTDTDSNNDILSYDFSAGWQVKKFDSVGTSLSAYTQITSNTVNDNSVRPLFLDKGDSVYRWFQPNSGTSVLTMTEIASNLSGLPVTTDLSYAGDLVYAVHSVSHKPGSTTAVIICESNATEGYGNVIYKINLATRTISNRLFILNDSGVRSDIKYSVFHDSYLVAATGDNSAYAPYLHVIPENLSSRTQYDIGLTYDADASLLQPSPDGTTLFYFSDGSTGQMIKLSPTFLVTDTQAYDWNTDNSFYFSGGKRLSMELHGSYVFVSGSSYRTVDAFNTYTRARFDYTTFGALYVPSIYYISSDNLVSSPSDMDSYPSSSYGTYYGFTSKCSADANSKLFIWPWDFAALPGGIRKLTSDDIKNKLVYIAKTDSTTGSVGVYSYGELITGVISGVSGDPVYISGQTLSLTPPAIDSNLYEPIGIVSGTADLIYQYSPRQTVVYSESVADAIVGPMGDYTTIEDALDSTAAGSSIFVQPGTYTPTRQLVFKNGHKLYCLDGAATISFPTDLTLTEQIVNKLTVTYNLDPIVFSGFNLAAPALRRIKFATLSEGSIIRLMNAPNFSFEHIGQVATYKRQSEYYFEKIKRVKITSSTVSHNIYPTVTVGNCELVYLSFGNKLKASKVNIGRISFSDTTMIDFPGERPVFMQAVGDVSIGSIIQTNTTAAPENQLQKIPHFVLMDHTSSVSQSAGFYDWNISDSVSCYYRINASSNLSYKIGSIIFDYSGSYAHYIHLVTTPIKLIIDDNSGVFNITTSAANFYVDVFGTGTITNIGTGVRVRFAQDTMRSFTPATLDSYASTQKVRKSQLAQTTTGGLVLINDDYVDSADRVQWWHLDRIYSATEKPTGRWIDKKKTYQKVVTITSFPDGTTTATKAHSITGIDNLIDGKICYKNTSTGEQGVVYMAGSSANVDIETAWIDNTNINWNSFTSRVANHTAFAILEYTKV